MAIRATGAAELRRIAAACRREVSGSRASNEIASRMKGAGSSIRTAIVTNVVSVLPHRGGLGQWVAEANIDFSSIRRGKSGGLAVRVGKGRHDLAGLDEGLVIHPFYGRSPWSSQLVFNHSISDPIRDEGGDRLQEAVEYAATRMAERIARA